MVLLPALDNMPPFYDLNFYTEFFFMFNCHMFIHETEQRIEITLQNLN
jgi:hypothetical protein